MEHSNVQQFHPISQKKWHLCLTKYSMKIKDREIDHQRHRHRNIISSLQENYANWDNPYANIGFWPIIDFLRDFKLTK